MFSTGNFLWGYAAKEMMWMPQEAITGAHLNELFSLDPKFDSKADQSAIWNGYWYSNSTNLLEQPSFLNDSNIGRSRW